MSKSTFVATVAAMKKDAGDIPGQTCPHIDDAVAELRRAKDHLRAAVKDRDGAYWWECDTASDNVDDAMGKLESLRKDNERLRDLGREWYENSVLVAVEADARITLLERELAEARRNLDAAILKEAIGEGSHRKICDDLIALRGSIAPLHTESADRLRIIEEVAAVIGFKYPSECRDFLAQRVREKIEEAQTAGRVLADELVAWKSLGKGPRATRYDPNIPLSEQPQDTMTTVAVWVFRDIDLKNASKKTSDNPTALAWIKQAQEEESNGN